MNLDQLFHKRVARNPSHPALIGPSSDQRLSYAELNAEIDARAARLQEAGIDVGDAVGLHLASGVDYIISTYALWRCGASVVPVPMELASDEKRRIVQEIHLQALISEEREAGFASGFSRGNSN